jgi:hypothetical protein
MTTSVAVAVPSEVVKWQCQFCHKHYQPNYKYKIHLGKCLVFKAKLKNERDALVDSMLQLKQELKKELTAAATHNAEPLPLPLPLPPSPPPISYSRLFQGVF